ncbi:MAG TPA: hypothetical protein VHO90_13705 [Bacteroidales bacterium]|nr:hypothetical protein [Bacteroidales bacterium]
MELMLKMREAGHDPTFSKNTSFERMQISLINQVINSGYPLHFKKSLWFNIKSLDPTTSLNLINFCCAIPETLYKKHSYDRIMVKKGMADLLPSRVLFEPRKGLQASDKVERFSNLSPDCFSEITNMKYIKASDNIFDSQVEGIGKLSRYISINSFLKKNL